MLAICRIAYIFAKCPSNLSELHNEFISRYLLTPFYSSSERIFQSCCQGRVESWGDIANDD